MQKDKVFFLCNQWIQAQKVVFAVMLSMQKDEIISYDFFNHFLFTIQ
jgi:hypothetical protein